MLLVWIIIYVATMLVQFLIDLGQGNLEKMIQGMFMLSTDSAMMCKFLSLRHYNHLVRECIDGLNHPFLAYLNPTELNELKASVKGATRLRNSYFIGCMVVLVSINIFPLFSSKRDLIFPAYFPFDVNSHRKLFKFIPILVLKSIKFIQVAFWMIYNYQAIGITLQCFFNLSSDTFFASYLNLMGAHMSILQIRIRNIKPNHEDIKNCIEHHRHITR